MPRRATLGRILPKVRRGQLHPKPGRRFGCWRKFQVGEEAVWQGFGCGQPGGEGGACVWQVAAVAVVKAQGLNGQAVAPAELLATLAGKVAVAADTAQPRVRELCLHKKLLQTIILPQTPLRLMRIWNRIPDTMHLEPGSRCAAPEPLMHAATHHL